MATLHHQVWINAPVSKIYAALATAEGLGQWWAPHTATETPEGQVLSHDPGPQHGKVEFVVLEDAPFSRVEWQVISTHPERSPAYGWMGTRISFEISEQENPGAWRGISDPAPLMAVLEFRHSGWDENSEFFGFCNFAWGETLAMLRNWCEAKVE